MPYTVYILHSEKLDRFYTGKTSLSAQERLEYHLYKHKGFTAKANDWEIVFTKQLDSNHEAIKFENKIKKRGAKRFLSDCNQSG